MIFPVKQTGGITLSFGGYYFYWNFMWEKNFIIKNKIHYKKIKLQKSLAYEKSRFYNVKLIRTKMKIGKKGEINARVNEHNKRLCVWRYDS